LIIDDVSRRNYIFSNFSPELAGDLPEKCPILVESPVFIGLVVHFGGGIVEVCRKVTFMNHFLKAFI
jgi:hypothetical protein